MSDRFEREVKALAVCPSWTTECLGFRLICRLKLARSLFFAICSEQQNHKDPR